MQTRRFSFALFLLRAWPALWPFARGKELAARLVAAACGYGLIPPEWRDIAGRWYWIDLADFVSRSIAVDGTFDAAVIDHILACLPVDGTFIDVGANIGSGTLAASGRAGRIVAIEPNPHTARVLRRNLAHNGVHNAAVFEGACSNDTGETELYLPPRANSGRASLPRANAGTATAVPVPCSRLDDIALEFRLERVDLVKIDVEGAELAVLRGMAYILQEFHPALIIKVDESRLAAFNSSSADIQIFLAARGYRSAPIDATNLLSRFENGPENVEACSSGAVTARTL